MGIQISITRVYLFPIDPSLLPPTAVHTCQLMVITEHPLRVTVMVHVSWITTLRRVHLPIMSVCV